MSDILEAAVTALAAKLGASFDGSAKFEIEGEGGVIVDADGVRRGDAPTDVTLTADADTFRDLLDGNLNPTSAFMSGRLKVDGDMGTAMRLGALLA